MNLHLRCTTQVVHLCIRFLEIFLPAPGICRAKCVGSSDTLGRQVSLQLFAVWFYAFDRNFGHPQTFRLLRNFPRSRPCWFGDSLGLGWWQGGCRTGRSPVGTVLLLQGSPNRLHVRTRTHRRGHLLERRDQRLLASTPVPACTCNTDSKDAGETIWL